MNHTLILSLFLVMSAIDQINSEIKQFSYHNLKKAMEEKHETPLIIVDVREQIEIEETGMIPGSIHVPLGEVESALNSTPEEFQQKYNSEKPKQNENLVFVCKIGGRSLKACQIASKLGYKKVINYQRGWIDWCDKNRHQNN